MPDLLSVLAVKLEVGSLGLGGEVSTCFYCSIDLEVPEGKAVLACPSCGVIGLLAASIHQGPIVVYTAVSVAGHLYVDISEIALRSWVWFDGCGCGRA